MKKTEGGGWKAVAIGLALATPWLIGNMRAGPPTPIGAMQIEELSAAHEARGALENGEQRLGLCADPALGVLAELGFEEL